MIRNVRFWIVPGWLGPAIIFVALIALAVMFTGCRYVSDQTANSGGRVEFSVVNPCARGTSGELPVGGNTGSPNTTTRGGNADTKP